MFRNCLLSSVLLGFVAVATAAPITFTDPNYSVTAIVGVDDLVDSASDTSPPTTIPLNVAKPVLTDADSAFASASAALGKLSAVTNASSTGGFADAVRIQVFLALSTVCLAETISWLLILLPVTSL